MENWKNIYKDEVNNCIAGIERIITQEADSIVRDAYHDIYKGRKPKCGMLTVRTQPDIRLTAPNYMNAITEATVNMLYGTFLEPDGTEVATIHRGLVNRLLNSVANDFKYLLEGYTNPYTLGTTQGMYPFTFFNEDGKVATCVLKPGLLTDKDHQHELATVTFDEDGNVQWAYQPVTVTEQND